MNPETLEPHPAEPPKISNLRRLKDLPPEDRDRLFAEKEHHTCARMIDLVATRHGIIGLTQPDWSKFYHWMHDQRELHLAHEAASNIREIFDELLPGAGAEETHKFFLQYFTNLGFAHQGEGRERALRFIITELRHAAIISQYERRLRLFEQKAEREPPEETALSIAEKNQRIREIFHLDPLPPAPPPQLPHATPENVPPSAT